MSLVKQLWLFIIVLTGFSLLGSFIIGSLASKTHIEQELYRKNQDSAHIISLSIANHSDDQLSLDLMLRSQFDIGHFELVNLVDTQGNTVISLVNANRNQAYPRWFAELMPIKTYPFTIKVSDGWRQTGTLTVASDRSYAQYKLWQNVVNLVLYFVVLALIVGVVGGILLRRLTRPLLQTVRHAQAIGERRFITSEEPKTEEFRAVIRSMNALSLHVKTMLEEEADKLEQWRRLKDRDELTGLLSRAPLLSQLRSSLAKEDDSAGGLFVIVRVVNLFALNQSEGRQSMDNYLTQLANEINNQLNANIQARAGRLNGSDFAILFPGYQSLPNHPSDSEGAARTLFEALNAVSRNLALDAVTLHMACTAYLSQENIRDVLTRADTILLSLSEESTSNYILHSPTEEGDNAVAKDWRTFLDKALEHKRFTLALYPVLGREGKLIHWEAPARILEDDSQPLSAGVFMPHIRKFDMGARLDAVVVELAIKQVAASGKNLGVNLSSSILSDTSTMEAFASILREHPQAATQLWFEIPAHGVFQNIDGFKKLCDVLKPTGCRIGIEHFGHEAVHIGRLHDLGLDYIKVDRAFIFHLEQDDSYQVFLRGLCTIVHSIGLKVFAEGVGSERVWETLLTLGFDGGTGEYCTAVERLRS